VDNDDTELVHRRAVEALGFSSRKEVPPLIEKAYASKNSDWQITALFAMGRSANSRWNSRVLKMLDHTKPDIRAEAAGAAGELEIADAKPALFDLLQDSDLDVRMAAAWSLSQIGGSGVREALESQLESTDLDEEAEHLEASLENLEFTDEMRNISLMEIPEDGDESDPSSEDDFDAYDDDLFSEDGKD
jgi:HEAT repeat protein